VAEEKRNNRWLLNTVLILATVSLLGVSAFPLFMSMGNLGSQQPGPTVSQTPQARQEELKKQAEGYALVLQREPENQTALRGLLETRLALADVKGAVEPLEKLVKLNPNDAQMSVLLAQAKQQNGDLESAAQVYRDVLQKKPGDLDVLGGLSALLVTQNKPEAAISLLKDTLKEAPKVNQAAAGSVDTAAVQILLGKVYANQKRYEEAIASFDTAAKDNPQNFQPVYYKASVLKEQGKAEEAKPLFDKAAALAPAQFKDQINRDANPQASPSAIPGGDATAKPSDQPAAVPNNDLLKSPLEAPKNTAPQAAPSTKP
jgi:tetratricopeptide (TPR) repeat protein